MIRAEQVLVVSECYAPDVFGGAETSLRLTLEELVRRGHRPVVAALSHRHAALTRETLNGVEVHRVPWPSAWLPQSDDPVGTAASGTKSAVRRAAVASRYIASPGSSRTTDRLRRMADRRAIDKAGHTALLPLLDLDRTEMSRASGTLRELIARLRPSIVHADNLDGILVAAEACPPDTPIVSFVRDHRFFCSHALQAMMAHGHACVSCRFECMHEIPTAAREALERLMNENREYRLQALRKSRALIVASAYMQTQARAIAPELQTLLVPNPADPVQIGGSSSKTPPQILFVGSLTESKGVSMLLDAAGTLVARKRAFRIVMAGRAPISDAPFREQALRLGLEARVEWTGFLDRSELFKRYACCAVVCCPSLWPEPFGRIPLEAGSSGKPVVAFASGGLKETVLHGETGFLVTPGDAHALAGALEQLLTQPDLSKQMGEKALKHIKKNFGVTRSADALLRAWKKISSMGKAKREGRA